jgi:signal transduction histidine kinase
MAAAHGGGTLTVRAQLSAVSPQPSAQEQGGPWIEVRIQDDGPGIAPEHRAKLFEPFFSTKPPEEGTGLGLWMVRTFVVTHQGTVDYETEVGRGTTFIVRLPVLSPAQPGADTSPVG